VLVPRPPGGELSDRLAGLGAIPVAIPLIEIRPVAPGGPLDAAARAAREYDWIVVTSANGARALFTRMRGRGLAPPDRPRWAAVGPATAAALAAAGVQVTRIPESGTGAAIAGELGDLDGRRVLLPRARIASADLPEALVARGARVDAVPAYDTVVGPESSREPLARALDTGLEAAIFTSGSTVEGFARLAGSPGSRLVNMTTVCIGPTTARALEQAGVRPSGVASDRTAEALVEALEEIAHARA
jgi:uroporphyrinogen-III synthase